MSRGMRVSVYYSDEEIARLLEEPKPLPADWARVRPKAKRGHHEAELQVTGADGGEFLLILRQNARNQLDFSVIVAYRPRNTNRIFRLRRYNGRSHEHSNRIEGERFYGFHVHTATERYQALGAREDDYAEPTNRYGSYAAAVELALDECRFIRPLEPNLNLFDQQQ